MMRRRFCQWLRQATRRVQQGQGLVEYGLLATLISIAAIAIMSVMGTSITSLYSQASTVFP
jgi:Flp pilus assembly pilin Flp